MYDQCPSCGLKFYREQGYFLGAMYISYIISAGLICAFALLLWALTKWSFEGILAGALVMFLPLALPITFFSRVLWIYWDQWFDPEEK